MPKISEQIVDILGRECMHLLEPAFTVPRLYRRTNREAVELGHTKLHPPSLSLGQPFSHSEESSGGRGHHPFEKQDEWDDLSLFPLPFIQVPSKPSSYVMMALKPLNVLEEVEPVHKLGWIRRIVESVTERLYRCVLIHKL